jgi:exodeoxyribonuclease VIII
MEHLTPGIHDITAERYHAAAGVSCSMLNILRDKTPMHLHSWMNGELKIETEALRFGTICHYAVLEGDKYKKLFFQRPEGMKLNTKEGKAWLAKHPLKKRPNVSFEEGQAIKGMVAAVRNHPFARRVLSSGKPEQSLFVMDDQDTLRKSRLDMLTDGNIIPDLKTCASASNDFFERQILRLHYHVRAAYYLDNCRLSNIDKEHYMFILVEKTPPYAVRCLKMDGDCVTWGRKLYQADMQTWRQCIANDEWPGYEDGYAEITLPQWEMRRIYELI